jgi:type IV fimbrial biogenesis protein FimT
MIFFSRTQMRIARDGVHSIGDGPVGFTLVELLLVIAILLALAAVATPNLSDWASNQRLKSAARDVVTHFQYARLEAVKRSTTIALTFNYGGPGDDNYTVFVDDGAGGGNPGNLIQDNDSEQTLIWAVMPGDVSLVSTFTNNRVGYNARGFPVGGNGGRVTVSSSTGRSYDVIMQPISGGISLTRP